jgi:hypothetical protein
MPQSQSQVRLTPIRSSSLAPLGLSSAGCFVDAEVFDVHRHPLDYANRSLRVVIPLLELRTLPDCVGPNRRRTLRFPDK